MCHVTVVHIFEQRRRRLRQRSCELAQCRKLPFGLWLVDSVEIRGPQKTAHGVAERRQLLRRHEMFGDVEQDDRDAIIVRRTDGFGHPAPPIMCERFELRSRAEILQHAPQVVMAAEREDIQR